jgi:hypothetical protein
MRGVMAKARNVPAAAAALLLLNACGPVNQGDCSGGDVRRQDNALRHC